ncbi:MAG: CBS domain-containing protein [Thermoplasmatota archaeon]
MPSREETLISEFYEAKVKDLMDIRVWDLPLIEKDAAIPLVLSILDGKTHVWVVESLKTKELVGVITRHDILQILAPPRTYYGVFSLPKLYHHGIEGRAEDIMTKNPVTCRPHDTVADALKKMIRHNIRRLAVVTDHTIEGELTLRNLICKFYKATQYYPLNEETPQ